MSETLATPPLVVRYQNSAQDWKALQKSLTPRQRFMRRWGAILVLGAFIGLCCLPATAVLLALGKLTAVLTGWAMAAVFFVFMMFSIARSWRAPNEDLLRPATLALHPEFLEVYGDRGWERRDWALIARLQQTEELFIVHRDDGLVYAVPRRAFASGEAEEAFVRAAQRFHEQARTKSDLDRPASWQDAAPAAVFAADTLQITYATDAPELVEMKQGMVLHPVDEAPTKAKPGVPLVWGAAGLIIVAAVLVSLRGEGSETGMGMLMGLIFFPLSALLMILPTLGILRLFGRRRQVPPLSVRQTLTISPSGISLWAPRLETRSTWDTIDAVQQNDKVIVFSANRPAVVHLYVVPKSAFSDEFEARHFAETAARYLRAAKTAVEAEPADLPRAVSDNPYQPPQAR
jgi:hypothetical protein